MIGTSQYNIADNDAPLVYGNFGRSWARISKCGRYRYILGRGWNGGLPTMVLVMINPSDADHEKPDPTVTRGMDFAAASGHGGLIIVNLFAWRDKDVRVLPTVDDPVGPFNDYWIDQAITNGTTVWAPGSPTKVPAALRLRFTTVRDRLLRDGRHLHALAFNKDGWPSHPLMLKKECRPIRWMA